jgi:hypothetical protein
MQPDRDREAAFEALLQGRDPGDGFGSLASFAEDVRAATGGPAPEPSATLAVVLQGGATVDGDGDARAARPAARLAGAALRVKVALAAAVVATGVGAAAAGLLPEPVADAVRPIVELVTPFEVPAPDDHGHRRPAGHRDVRDGLALDEGEPPPGTDPSATPGPAGTGQTTPTTWSGPTPTAIARSGSAATTVPAGSVTATPPGTAADAAKSSVDPGPGAGSPAPESTASSHGGRPAPGTVPGQASQPPATPWSRPPGNQGGDQDHTLGDAPVGAAGGPSGEGEGGPGVRAPARPDDPGPPDDAGGGTPAPTELQITTDTVDAAADQATPEPPEAQPG